MSVFRAAPLTEDLVDKAFALIQLSDPTLTAEMWRVLARRSMADQAAGRGGVVVLKDADGYVAALIDFARLGGGSRRARVAIRRVCAPALVVGQSERLAQELVDKAEAYVAGALDAP